MEQEIRLNKYLAACGIDSRRGCDDLILHCIGTMIAFMFSRSGFSAASIVAANIFAESDGFAN